MEKEHGEWPHRMNPTDALFWQLDKIPEMRSTIGALVLLRRPVSRERMGAEFDRVSSHLPRMRQCVAEVPFALAPPEWVEDAQFDLDYHVRYVAVPAPGGLAELLAELAPLYATALDPDRPLWEVYVADGGLADGRGAFFLKTHHCLTDGVGGSRVFTSLMRERSPVREPSRRVSPPRDTRPAALLWRAAQYNLGDALATTAAFLEAATDAVRKPRQAVAGLRSGLRAIAGFSRELLVPRAESPLHGCRSLSRQLATFEMALGEIDAVRARLSATNNDVVLTVVAGAMHRWHAAHGADVRQLRVLVPVSLRPSGDALAGNRLALLAVSLPVGEPDPLRRLRLIQERMGRVKADRRATLYPLLARFMTAMPTAVAARLGRQQTNRTNFVCTNVPGPRETCSFAGEAMERIYPYAPLVGDHPVAMALYSYRDWMNVGLDVDPLAMTDLPRFLEALQESYTEVLTVGRQAEPPSPRRAVRRGHRAPRRRRRR